MFLVSVGGSIHNNEFSTIEEAKKHIEEMYNYDEYPELGESATIYEVVSVLRKIVTRTITWSK